MNTGDRSRTLPLKVVHLWKSDGPAGAGGGIVMTRIHEALKARGVDSTILCEFTDGGEPDVIRLPGPTKLERRIGRWTKRFGLNDVHRISSFNLRRHPTVERSDVVVVHGTHHGFMNYLALPWLSRSKPTIFVLHDMWAFTGHCAYSFDCERWRTGCGHCPRLDTPPAVTRDSTWLEWRLKRLAFRTSKMVLVSPSTELERWANETQLGRLPVHRIPHGLDTLLYRPLDKEKARNALGIPPGKKVLMFAAVDLTEWRKGGDSMPDLLRGLRKSVGNSLFLLTIGRASDGLPLPSGVEHKFLGYLESDTDKALAYSAADVFVSPTRGEAFGLTILEAMACGTPPVAFAVGGVNDIISHMDTGYLAKPDVVSDLSRGVLTLFQDDSLRRQMQANGPERVHEHFALDSQVNRYLDLFDQMRAA